MTPVSVSDLKARLSHYLRQVRRGGEIQILDRGRPVARLVAMPPDGGNDELRSRLIAAGVVRPGTGSALLTLEKEPLDLGTDVSQALDHDRAERV